MASATSQVVRSINRSRSWALTGTPIENTPDDLVGIFEFLSPGYLRPGLGPRRLSELVHEHILRRTKDMVLTDLPPKLFRDAELDLSPEQRATYEMAENEGVMHLNKLGDAITIQHVFELVLRLKQICNFDPATKESAKLDQLAADLAEVADSGRKAIVFSQWVEPLEFLARQLGVSKQDLDQAKDFIAAILNGRLLQKTGGEPSPPAWRRAYRTGEALATPVWNG